MNPLLKECPHCRGPLRLGEYSQDDASVTVISCGSKQCSTKYGPREVAQCYIGADDWRYNRAGSRAKYDAFIAEWKEPAPTWSEA
jgi:hypothetical protein